MAEVQIVKLTAAGTSHEPVEAGDTLAVDLIPLSADADNMLEAVADGLKATPPFPAVPTNPTDLPAALGVDENGNWVWHKIGC